MHFDRRSRGSTIEPRLRERRLFVSQLLVEPIGHDLHFLMDRQPRMAAALNEYFSWLTKRTASRLN